MKTKIRLMLKMMLTSILTVGFLQGFAQDKYFTKEGFASFFSHAPLEDIKAEHTKVGVILNTNTNELKIRMAIKGFMFEKGLMQEHFNENYMESDKYKDGSFDGTITEKIDYTKDGTYSATAKGNINIHGVERPIEIPGKLIIEKGVIHLTTEFPVKIKDHDIKIEMSKLQNISEEVKVSFKAELKPYVIK